MYFFILILYSIKFTFIASIHTKDVKKLENLKTVVKQQQFLYVNVLSLVS